MNFNVSNRLLLGKKGGGKENRREKNNVMFGLWGPYGAEMSRDDIP